MCDKSRLPSDPELRRVRPTGSETQARRLGVEESEAQTESIGHVGIWAIQA